MNVNKLASDLAVWYGDGMDGSCPTTAQWERILSRPADRPITLINLFKMRAEAEYATGEAGVSGEEAFRRYASTSVPSMERVGGTFLFVGPFQGAFVGPEENWDVVAIGQYPDLDTFVALQTDETYRGCYHHRTAACSRQKVIICGDG